MRGEVGTKVEAVVEDEEDKEDEEDSLGEVAEEQRMAPPALMKKEVPPTLQAPSPNTRSKTPALLQHLIF